MYEWSWKPCVACSMSSTEQRKLHGVERFESISTPWQELGEHERLAG